MFRPDMFEQGSEKPDDGAASAAARMLEDALPSPPRAADNATPVSASDKSTPATSEADIDKMITGLSSANYREREKASAALCAMGPAAVKKIGEALDSQDPEVRRRAKELIWHRINHNLDGADWDRTETDLPNSLNKWSQHFRDRVDSGYPIEGIDQFLHTLKQLPEIKPETAAQIEEIKLLSDILKARSTKEDGAEYKQTISLLDGKREDLSIDRDKLLNSFSVVDLKGTAIGQGNCDESLKVLLKLPKLRDLRLSYKIEDQLTDQGLRNIAQLKELKSLELRSCYITDNGLSALSGMTKLENLDLGNCNQITDDGFQKLKGLTKLQTLDLGGTSITDQSIKQLAQMKDLQSLSLPYMNLTDASVKSLATLSKLKFLQLSESGISAAGLAKLKSALPGCQIEWSPKKEPAKHT
jgi:hypothetical protein